MCVCYCVPKLCRFYGWISFPKVVAGHALGNESHGPNLTKVGTSPLLEWGRPTSPLQWTNGDGSRWRLSAGGATCQRTAAASAWMGQGSYEGVVAMRALKAKLHYAYKVRNIGRVRPTLRFLRTVLVWLSTCISYQLNIFSDYAIAQYRTNASDIAHFVGMHSVAWP